MSSCQKQDIAQVLEKKLGAEFIAKRSGPGGSTVSYIEGWKAIQIANEIFGYNGWNHSVMDITVDVDGGRVSLGISAIIRVTLRDGTFHEDIGYGSIENAKNKGVAFEKAKKEAVTDGLKRALKAFGNATGNCLYDKNYLKKIQKVGQIPDQELKFEDLYHSTKASVASSSNIINPKLSNPINTAVPTSIGTNLSTTKGFVHSKSSTNLNTRESAPKLEPDLNSTVTLSSVEKSISRSVSCNNLKSINFDEDAFLIAADLETMDVSLLEFEDENQINPIKKDQWTKEGKNNSGVGLKGKNESFRTHPYPPV